MKLKIDWQHVILVLISALTACGPALLSHMSQDSLASAYKYAGPIMAVLTTCLAILKASIVQPAALPPEAK